MDEPEGSHRTRSKAAPDWTVPESLVLVNEISAVEAEWGATLPSFQKWQQIVENCNSLDVNRSLNQCKRHWEALLSSYRRARDDATGDFLFPVELFESVDRCVRGSAKNAGGGAEEREEMATVAMDEKQVVTETDLDSELETQRHAPKLFLGTGSRKRKTRMKRQKRSLEARIPWGYFTSTKIKHEEPKNAGNRDTIVGTMAEGTSETEDLSMAKILQENALQIHAILEGKLSNDDDADHKKNGEAVGTEFARRQGDQLIDCLGKISETLNQLCDLVQECN
ncbi:uncharacterized protein LOC127243434 [Andrographis paniculata]|uniref:uncharacterized protein LOC127243434 n=1 Tax=Andrographis paniculata TaxID=175694 RepID=UPI0021E91DA3|nr:uncharacterized protein LOC127243434 [Andrographis paniculata]